MRRRVAAGPVWLIALCLSAPADTQTVRTIYTVPNAILCASPFSLKEARTAVAANDDKWLHELDCAKASGNMAVTVIESSLSLNFFKVRVQPNPGGEAMTLYGPLSDFTEPAARPALKPGKTKTQ